MTIDHQAVPPGFQEEDWLLLVFPEDSNNLSLTIYLHLYIHFSVLCISLVLIVHPERLFMHITHLFVWLLGA